MGRDGELDNKILQNINLIYIVGDKLGETNLHLYWADFENGLGQPNRIFRKVEIELFEVLP